METPEIRSIPLSKLYADPEVQRGMDPRKVAKIADNMSEAALGTVTVSRRDSGMYHIADGQHRCAAARQVFGDDYTMTCRVFNSLTVQEEAGLFRLLNNTTRPQAVDAFRIRVVEGDPVAVAVSRIVEDNGWKVVLGGRDNHFSAVAAAERVYRLDPDAFERTVSILTRAWGHQHDAVDNRIVEGLGLVLARYGAAVDLGSMTDRLARYNGGPGKLIGNARTLSDALGVTVTKGMAEAIVEIYNKSKTTRALPPWRSS
jgi:hypothetical protein